jgi:hypothetical protein
LQLDPVDPPETSSAWRDKPQRKAVSRAQWLSTHAGRKEQSVDLVDREADPVAGDGMHEQALGVTDVAQEG